MNLLPCPFCGGSNIHYSYDKIPSWPILNQERECEGSLTCLDCDAGIYAYFDGISEQAIKDELQRKWNRRADVKID